MIRIPYICYSIVVGLLLLRLLGKIAYTAYLHRQRRGLDEVARRVVARWMARPWITEEERLLLPFSRSSVDRMRLAETLSRLISATYGADRTTLQMIVRAYGLERYLLRRARRSRGLRRACCLRLLADLPIGARAMAEVAHYRLDRQREVRFAALLVQLAAQPEQMLRLVAEYDEPMRGAEIAEILHLLRRGALPIAYQPLLGASNENLNRIGFALVVQFGIEQAEPELLRLVARTGRVGVRALYVLAALHRPMQRRVVILRIRRLSPAERRSLLRYMVSQEYTAEQLRSLFGAVESPYSERLVASYKRSLVCLKSS